MQSIGEIRRLALPGKRAADVARLLECGVSMLHQVETGQSAPVWRRWRHWASVLGLDIEDLYEAIEETRRRRDAGEPQVRPGDL